jgi:hypothetical protein
MEEYGPQVAHQHELLGSSEQNFLDLRIIPVAIDLQFLLNLLLVAMEEQ